MNRVLIPCCSLAGFLLCASSIVGFPQMPYPPLNPSSQAKIDLGRRLFYDPILSRDQTISCSSCHQQKNAFADTRVVSLGVQGQLGQRNSPSLGNVGYRNHLMWNGASPQLELQAMIPLTSHIEMDLDVGEVVKRLSNHPDYVERFKQAFGSTPSMNTTVQALATFERTLISSNSPYDLFNRGVAQAISPAAKRGLSLFQGKAECFHCHVGVNLTDSKPHNNAFEQFNIDLGVGELTEKDEDIGKFITPSLRNIALTAPYMHNGSIKTLREVIDHYNQGGQPNLNIDPLIRILNLSDSEKEDILAFLESLTDAEFIQDPKLSSPFSNLNPTEAKP